MYGEWLRLTPAELDRARTDPDWVLDMVMASDDMDDDNSTPEASARARYSGTDKTWHALSYLLYRAEFPIEIIMGEQPLIASAGNDEDDEESEEESGDDWSYGPPGYLTPDQVRQAAVALADITEASLIDGIDPADLTRNHVYPEIWDRPDELKWAVHAIPYIKAYFAAAAEAGEGIMCWIG
jgi:Domain of unknown function (DUF1877)